MNDHKAEIFMKKYFFYKTDLNKTFSNAVIHPDQ